MKFYNAPFAEVVGFKSADIITLSAYDALAEDDNTIIAPGNWFD